MDLEKYKEKIEQNTQEKLQFEKNLHSLLNGDKKLASRPLFVSKTANALAICGADGNLPLTITKKVVDKVLRPEIRDENGRLTGKTGHDLSEKQLFDSLVEIKNPAIVLKGKKDSLVVVTTQFDSKNRNIIIPIDLHVQEGRTVVNSVRSVYGRDNFSIFLEKNILDGNVMAINIEKANKIFQSIGKWYPKEEKSISFDDSIVYTTENVKYPQKNLKENNSLEPQGDIGVKDLPESVASPKEKPVKPSFTLNTLKQNKVEKDIRDAATPKPERTVPTHKIDHKGL